MHTPWHTLRHTLLQKDRCAAIVFIYNEEIFQWHDLVINNNASLIVVKSTKESAFSFDSILKKRTLLRKTDVSCGLRPSEESTGISWNEHLTDYFGKLFVTIYNYNFVSGLF